jgi:hypothetical protein
MNDYLKSDPFGKEVFGKIALEKMRKQVGVEVLHPDFRIYEAGWLEAGLPCTWDTMELKGAKFRVATKGPRKGLLCIMVPGTKLTAYVTKSEIQAFERSKE